MHILYQSLVREVLPSLSSTNLPILRSTRKTTALGQNLHPEGQANSLPAPDFIPSKAYPVFRPDPACCLHIRHRTNKGGPSAAILLQQYKEYERSRQYSAPHSKPTSSIDMFSSDNYWDEF